MENFNVTHSGRLKHYVSFTYLRPSNNAEKSPENIHVTDCKPTVPFDKTGRTLKITATC